MSLRSRDILVLNSISFSISLLREILLLDGVSLHLLLRDKLLSAGRILLLREHLLLRSLLLRISELLIHDLSGVLVLHSCLLLLLNLLLWSSNFLVLNQTSDSIRGHLRGSWFGSSGQRSSGFSNNF